MALIDEKLCLRSSPDGLEEFCLFWGQASPFSNWRACRFSIDGFEYTSGEQRMMHAKAIFFGDAKAADAIMDTPSPWRQKAMGRAIANYDDEQWSKVRLEMMVECVYHKAMQDPDIKAYLLSTGKTTIVEASPEDLVWGIGFRADDPQAVDRSQWLGENLLGIALTQARELIVLGLEPPRSACSLAMDKYYDPIEPAPSSSTPKP